MRLVSCVHVFLSLAVKGRASYRELNLPFVPVNPNQVFFIRWNVFQILQK